MVPVIFIAEYLIDFIQKILITFCFGIGHLMKSDKIEWLRLTTITFSGSRGLRLWVGKEMAKLFFEAFGFLATHLFKVY